MTLPLVQFLLSSSKSRRLRRQATLWELDGAARVDVSMFAHEDKVVQVSSKRPQFRFMPTAVEFADVTSTGSLAFAERLRSVVQDDADHVVLQLGSKTEQMRQVEFGIVSLSQVEHDSGMKDALTLQVPDSLPSCPATSAACVVAHCFFAPADA